MELCVPIRCGCQWMCVIRKRNSEKARERGNDRKSQRKTREAERMQYSVCVREFAQA